MGLPPTSPSHLGAPNRNDPQLDGQPIAGRGTPANGNADVQIRSERNTESTDASTLQIETVDKTPPPNPVKLAMDYWGHPKSPLDAVRGRIPTQDQIKRFVAKFAPADYTPKRTIPDDFSPESVRPHGTEQAEALNVYDETNPKHVLQSLLKDNLKRLDPDVVSKIENDDALMVKLQNFAKKYDGKIAFIENVKPFLNYKTNLLAVGVHHFHEEGADLHRELTTLFRRHPEPVHADVRPKALTDVTRSPDMIFRQLFQYDYGSIDGAMLTEIAKDTALMLKLDSFLTKTEVQGDIVFNDNVLQKVSYEDRFIGMAEYHLEAATGDQKRPNLHQALRERFEMPPLKEIAAAKVEMETASKAATSIQTEDVTNVREVELEQDATTDATYTAPDTTQPTAQADTELKSEDIDKMEPEERFVALNKHWTGLTAKNTGTVAPK